MVRCKYVVRTIQHNLFGKLIYDEMFDCLISPSLDYTPLQVISSIQMNLERSLGQQFC